MRRDERAISTRSRVLGSHLLLAFICLVLAGLLCGGGILIYEKNSTIDILEQSALRICENEQIPPDGGRRINGASLRVYEDLSNAAVCFLDPELQIVNVERQRGGALYDEATLKAWEDRLAALGEEQLEKLRGGQSISTPRTLGYFLNVRATAYAAMPFMDESGGLRGYVVLVRPVQRLTGVYRTGSVVILGAMLVSLFIASVLARRQTAWITKPLEMLSGQARKIMSGDYTPFAYPRTSEEMAVLGNSMNVLAEELRNTVDSLVSGKEQLEMILATIGEGVLAMDPSGELIHWNDTLLSLLGISAIGEVFTSDDLSIRILRESCLEVARSGQGQSLARTVRNGRQLTADIHALRRDDALTGSMCVVRDVSEAEELEEARRRYMANISHELRTPLTGIRGLIEPLIDGYIETEEEKRECYEVILSETIRLQKLVGDMLDLSHLESGGFTLETEDLDVGAVVASTVRSARVLARKKDLALELTLPEEPLVCTANEDRVQQVLLILLDNAMDYTEPGGSIRVDVSREGAWGVIRVTDTGCGIPPEVLPHIWERFYKADPARTRTKGVGIGLSIARLLVEMMAGEVRVVSQMGSGSVFSFTLPAAFVPENALK